MASTPQQVGEQSPIDSASNGKTQAVKVSLEKTADGRPRFHGCSGIKNYEVLGKLGEGTFGEVYKARSIMTGRVVALKKILMHNEKHGFPITALREIKLLKMLSHPNILKLEEMAVERTKGEGRKKAITHMVTPYMDHDLSGLLENPAVHFTEPQIKCYMLQLLEGLRYLHSYQALIPLAAALYERYANQGKTTVDKVLRSERLRTEHHSTPSVATNQSTASKFTRPAIYRPLRLSADEPARPCSNGNNGGPSPCPHSSGS